MDSINTTLICTYGFDGCSGNAQFNQQLNIVNQDESLFVHAMIPLRLQSEDGSILWNNAAPQSSRSCRPKKMEFIKESRDVIIEAKQDYDNEVHELETYTILLESKKAVTISFHMCLTLLDGKVLSHITNTSSYQCCPFCKASPKKFNDLDNMTNGVFSPDPNAIQFGMSILHLWIRIFEAILHLSYKQVITNGWQIRGDANKKLVDEKKKSIQKKFRERLNLVVDVPRGNGSGTSNTGNVSRRAFENTELLAEILEIDLTLIKNLKTILLTVSSHYSIDPVKFDAFCIETARRYIEIYNRFPMTVTLHKIFIHGAQIISNAILPIGMMSEEAAEASNKNYKTNRLKHARLDSREHTMHDVFTRSMDTSDPLISSIRLVKRLKQKKRKNIPNDVKALLIFDQNEDEHVSEDEEEEGQEDDSNEHFFDQTLPTSDCFD